MATPSPCSVARKIRLEGIDGPERGAEFSAKVIEVRPKEKDRHGRTVARVEEEAEDTKEKGP